VVRNLKIQRKTASEMCKEFKAVMSVHSYLKVIVSDNVPFGSYEFRKCCQKHNIKLKMSSPNYPQSNGLSERAVQTAKQLLKKF